MISTRPATLKDVSAILAEPSRTTADELRRANVTGRQVLCAFREAIRTGDAVTLTVDGEPAFVLALFALPEENGTPAVATQFIAAEAFWNLGARGVWLGRRMLASIRRQRPGTALISASYSPHPEVERWFALLGFRKQRQEARAGVFLLPPKARHLGGVGSSELIDG